MNIFSVSVVLILEIAHLTAVLI